MSDIAAFASTTDLASASVGGQALVASDDFFASKDHLVDPKPASFDPTTYTERGKQMDGWESRRKRVPGHDWCIVRLGLQGRILGVDIDTSHFLGNHPPFASLDAAVADDAAVLSGEAEWVRLVPQIPLRRGSHNLAAVQALAGLADREFTHVRLNIYPDGGVARLRVYGLPSAPVPKGSRLDLASLALGARPLAASDVFFSPMTHLLLPGRSTYMGGGWETRRSRPPGEDWLIVALGVPGYADEILLDTGHFKGNYPDRAVVDGLWWPDAPAYALVGHPDWKPITAVTPLRADAEHGVAVLDRGPWTHVRLRIIPDGGMARMRVWGTPGAPDPDQDPLLRKLNWAPANELHAEMMRCCGSARWASAMVAGRPYTSRTHLRGVAADRWWHLEDRDWLEAFSHHPRIGASPATLRVRFGSTADWSSSEQSGVAEADQAMLEALAEGNRAYEAKFGHVFLICATGLKAPEMLAALQERFVHEPAAELRIAAGEQMKITYIRLEKLVEEQR
jgi:allantoicase